MPSDLTTRTNRRTGLAMLLSLAGLAATHDAGANHGRPGRRRRHRNRKRPAGFPVNCENLVPGAALIGCDYRERDLSGMNLEGANLDRTTLFRTNLAGANLAGARLRNADVQAANLVGASLARVRASRSYFNAANLSGAVLDFADLTDASLREAILPDPIPPSAKLCRTIMPDGSVSNRDCP